MNIYRVGVNEGQEFSIPAESMEVKDRSLFFYKKDEVVAAFNYWDFVRLVGEEE